MGPLATVLRAKGSLHLLGASLVGRLPTAMSALAIVQLVRLQGGDFAFAGVLTAVFSIAGAVGQPVLGRWIDRAGQTVVLVTAALASTLGFAGMAAFTPHGPALALVAAIVAGAFSPPLEPSLRSLWPRLVPDERALKSAFSLDAGAQEIIFIAGPLVTVAGIALFGATGDVLFAAALGLVGTLAFAANRTSRDTVPARAAREPHRSPMRTARFVRVVVFLFGIGLPIGVLTIVVTATGESRGIADFAGWALALNAFGALVGATVSALRPTRLPPERLLALCGFLLGLFYLPLAAIGLPTAALLALAAVAGLMLPPTLGQVFGWIHGTTDPRALVEANAWAISAISVGIAAGTTIAGLVVSASGYASLPFIVAGATAVTWLLSLGVIRLPGSRVPDTAIPFVQSNDGSE